MMFGEFMKKYSVCPRDAIWARNNFELRGQKLMKDSLSRAHRDKKKPRWLGDHVWNGLCEHWETPKFKEKSVQAKANRASDREGFGETLHIGGSITTSQHRDNLVKKNGFNPSPLDLFRSTHQRKDDTFVDKKSEHVDGTYVCEMEDRMQRASEQNLPPPNELDVWREVAGMKKGRIYGLGLESTIINKQYHGSCSSSSEWVRRS
uniref:Transposase-associated domain-containing protein n=1 Tax=Lotus japonicus TaxID=34305 RepID=I3SWI3_LOTJA|nr:unknown [Lotus japonicus]